MLASRLPPRPSLTTASGSPPRGGCGRPLPTPGVAPRACAFATPFTSNGRQIRATPKAGRKAPRLPSHSPGLCGSPRGGRRLPPDSTERQSWVRQTRHRRPWKWDFRTTPRGLERPSHGPALRPARQRRAQSAKCEQSHLFSFLNNELLVFLDHSH